MLRFLSYLVVLATVLYAGACVALFVAQRSLIYYPQAHDPATPTPTLVLTRDGHKILASVTVKPGGKAIVYFGGNAENVSYSQPLLEQAFPGHSLYLLHYRGYGGSGGSPSESALVGDALALFDHVKAKHAEITIIGRSLGSGVAVQVASQRDANRLVLVTPFDSIAKLASQQFPWFPVNWILRDRYESWRHAGKVKAPTLLVVAEKDELIPVASSRALLSHFPAGVAKLDIIPGTGHNTISDHPKYVRSLYELTADQWQ